MKVGFVSPLPVPTDATAWHSSVPRAVRKTLRLPSVKTKSQTHAGVDHYMRTECRTDAYHTQNLEFLDRAYDLDEFGDIDNEYEGLTITDAMNEVELFAFCTGYDIL